MLLLINQMIVIGFSPFLFFEILPNIARFLAFVKARRRHRRADNAVKRIS